MTTVDQIKSAIETLSLSERAEIARFIHGWNDDAWDNQIKRDVDSGKYDVIIDEIKREIKTDRKNTAK